MADERSIYTSIYYTIKGSYNGVSHIQHPDMI